jgi:alkanesulfonate monooxygenase SsuD/methylene tetrahydromethanopterin reductase-like flavin-dependent oxidoreductase (luciferase family)
MRIGVKPGQWGWSFHDLAASWTAAEEAGFGILSCFDHVTSSPEGLAAWDAPSLVTAMAGVTQRIRLSVDVVNTALRHPYLLAAQLAVAQAASAGRLEVGLGTGSFHLARFDHHAIGRPFPAFGERLARLAACCQILPALWRGDSVTDENLGLQAASLGPIGIDPPPIVVGGVSERTMQVAAQYADGWSATETDHERYAELVHRMEETCRRVGRERPISRTVQIAAWKIDLGKAREVVERMEEAGATTALFPLHGPEQRGPDAVMRLADAVL